MQRADSERFPAPDVHTYMAGAILTAGVTNLCRRSFQFKPQKKFVGWGADQGQNEQEGYAVISIPGTLVWSILVFVLPKRPWKGRGPGMELKELMELVCMKVSLGSSSRPKGQQESK